MAYDETEETTSDQVVTRRAVEENRLQFHHSGEDHASAETGNTKRFGVQLDW